MSDVIISKLPVAFAQLVLFDSEAESPFNDWDSRHTEQGFSLRDNSISFALSDRVTEVDISLSGTNIINNNAYLGIKVPIKIYGSSGISVGSLLYQKIVKYKPGIYTVAYSLYRTENNSVDRVLFGLTTGYSDPVILVNDGSITRVSNFIMTASPA